MLPDYSQSLADYFDQPIPLPLNVEGWGQCELIFYKPEKVRMKESTPNKQSLFFLRLFFCF